MASLFTPTITYNPATDPHGSKANHYQIERSLGNGFIHECIADPITHFPTRHHNADSIVIAIAGSYRSDRHCWPGPRAGYAVFVGPSNPLNIDGAAVAKVPGQWMSMERGELSGAVAALRIVLRILERGHALRNLQSVIIKTDSKSLAHIATDRIYTWIRNGWVGSGNSRVRDWDLWDEYLLLLDQIQGSWGVDVSFWWVPSRWNNQARAGARSGIKVPPPNACRSPVIKQSSPESM